MTRSPQRFWWSFLPQTRCTRVNKDTACDAWTVPVTDDNRDKSGLARCGVCKQYTVLAIHRTFYDEIAEGLNKCLDNFKHTTIR